MIAKQASAMSMSELTLSLLQRDQPEIWHYLDQMPHSTPKAGLLYQKCQKKYLTSDPLLIYVAHMLHNHGLTGILSCYGVLNYLSNLLSHLLVK